MAIDSFYQSGEDRRRRRRNRRRPGAKLFHDGQAIRPAGASACRMVRQRRRPAGRTMRVMPSLRASVGVAKECSRPAPPVASKAIRHGMRHALGDRQRARPACFN